MFGPKHSLLCCGSFCGDIAHRITDLPLENATAKFDQVTIRQFQLENKKQINRITLTANNIFELQTILIAEIETYETLQGTASAAGTLVAGAVAADHTATREHVVRVFWDTVVGHIERYHWSSKRWGPELSTHLAMNSEFRLRKFCYDRICKEEEIGQLPEYGLDLNLSNDPDFVATPDKHVLFNRLRQSYHKKGCRFMYLFGCFEIDNIDWTRFGVYVVAITTNVCEVTVVSI